MLVTGNVITGSLPETGGIRNTIIVNMITANVTTAYTITVNAIMRT